MHGQGILDEQIDVDGAGDDPGPQRRSDLAIGPAIEANDVLLDLSEVWHGPFCERRGVFLDLTGEVILRIAHPETPDRVFGGDEVDDAAGPVLLGQFDPDTLITLVVIGLFERGARLFEVVEIAGKAGEGINRVGDFLGRKEFRPPHAELPDGKGEFALLFELLLRRRRERKWRRING